MINKCPFCNFKGEYFIQLPIHIQLMHFPRKEIIITDIPHIHCTSCVNDEYSDYNNYEDSPCCTHEAIEDCKQLK